MSCKRLIIWFIFFFSSPSLARFNHEDAAKIDTEERSNTETWNDKNSYRYPQPWNQAWRSSELGYRLNAGSLNVSRFAFEDDVKIAPNPLSTMTASFLQLRREDLVEESLEREIRVGWAFIPNMRISLLGDSDTFKEYGDLGLSLALWETPTSRTEIYYWSIDHYYKSKKSDDDAVRFKDSQSFGFVTKKDKTAAFIGWDLKFEMDTPLDWSHPAAGYRYEYSRRALNFRFDVPVTDRSTIYVVADQERKFEAKQSTVFNDVSKRMLRLSDVYEIGLEQSPEEQDITILALQLVDRRVDYKQGVTPEKTPLWAETQSPQAVRRKEYGFILTKHRPLADQHSIQNGVFFNSVHVREDARIWDTTEVKYQLLLDIKLNKNSMFVINTTWDIDQIVRDFPYSKKAPFRPWGGGDLQFMMKI
jgi:hypothetical protein